MTAEPEHVRISVRVPIKIVTRLQERARRSGVSLSDVVRWALIDLVNPVAKHDIRPTGTAKW